MMAKVYQIVVTADEGEAEVLCIAAPNIQAVLDAVTQYRGNREIVQLSLLEASFLDGTVQTEDEIQEKFDPITGTQNEEQPVSVPNPVVGSIGVDALKGGE
jgi:hypothetical protein